MANDRAAVDAVDAWTAPPETNNPAVAIAVMTTARLAVVSTTYPLSGCPARRHDGGGSQRRVHYRSSLTLGIGAPQGASPVRRRGAGRRALRLPHSRWRRVSRLVRSEERRVGEECSSRW